MKTVGCILLWTLLLELNNGPCYGSHIAGADLTYSCLGGNNYRLFFTFYRDCSGISVNPSYSFIGTSTCGGSVTVIVDLDSVSEISQLCTGLTSNCVLSASPIMGVEASYFHGDVVLPDTCNYWKFGPNPSICSRNAAITTLSPNGPTYCLYVEARINNSDTLCNNSPVYALPAPAFLCANQVQYYDFYALDDEHDSLRFDLYVPHSDTVNDVQYFPGFSGTQPVSYAGADSTVIDHATGRIRFHANQPQVTVAAVRINEYRNGIWLGSTERDVQLIFENCGNTVHAPVASGFNGSINFEANVCYDSLLNFQIITTDLDSDSTSIRYYGNIPGAQFTPTPGLFESGIFSWHPGINDIANNPHIFRLLLRDNGCPRASQSLYTYTINVDTCQAVLEAANPVFDRQKLVARFDPETRVIYYGCSPGSPGYISISLFDLVGRCKLKSEFLTTSDVLGTFDCRCLAPGIYLVCMQLDSGFTKAVKVVVN